MCLRRNEPSKRGIESTAHFKLKIYFHLKKKKRSSSPYLLNRLHWSISTRGGGGGCDVENREITQKKIPKYYVLDYNLSVFVSLLTTASLHQVPVSLSHHSTLWKKWHDHKEMKREKTECYERHKTAGMIFTIKLLRHPSWCLHKTQN